jgi:hypothetical protein
MKRYELTFFSSNFIKNFLNFLASQGGQNISDKRVLPIIAATNPTQASTLNL